MNSYQNKDIHRKKYKFQVHSNTITILLNNELVYKTTELSNSEIHTLLHVKKYFEQSNQNTPLIIKCNLNEMLIIVTVTTMVVGSKKVLILCPTLNFIETLSIAFGLKHMERSIYFNILKFNTSQTFFDIYE